MHLYAQEQCFSLFSSVTSLVNKIYSSTLLQMYQTDRRDKTRQTGALNAATYSTCACTLHTQVEHHFSQVQLTTPRLYYALLPYKAVACFTDTVVCNCT